MSKGSEPRNGDGWQCNGYRIYNGRGMYLKKKRMATVFPGVSSSLAPLSNIITCPSSPDAREPISVAIPFDLLRKKEALM
jgi:hypothetical protein